MLNSTKLTIFIRLGIYDEMKLQKLVDYFIEGIPDHESLMSMIDNNTHLSKSSSFPDH